MELLLELPHGLADRGSRNSELAGGSAEAPSPGDGQKRLELGKGSGIHGQISR